MKNLKSYLRKKVLIKYFILLYLCLLTHNAFAYIKFDVKPDMSLMNLADTDDYMQGIMSDKKLKQYMEKPLQKWKEKIKQTECAEYVQDFMSSMNFPDEPLTKQYLIEHELYNFQSIKDFIGMSQIQLIYFGECKNPTEESNKIKNIISALITETEKYKSVEKYKQAQSKKENENIPCNTLVKNQYESIKYNDLRRKHSDIQKVKRLTSYDIITFEYSLEALPELKKRLESIIDIYSSCANPTEESKRLLLEFKKTQQLLNSGDDYKQIVFDVMQNEYTKVQEILSSIQPTSEDLEKLKNMQENWGYRPLADAGSYPELNKKLQLIFESIKNKHDEIEALLNKEKEESNKIYNEKLLEEAIKKQKKTLKKLDLPKKILNANMYTYGTLDKPYIREGSVREVISLILHNPEIQKVSVKYNDDNIVFGIKKHDLPTKYYAFSIDDEDIYFKGVEKNGFIITSNKENFWELSIFFALRNLQY